MPSTSLGPIRWGYCCFLLALVGQIAWQAYLACTHVGAARICALCVGVSYLVTLVIHLRQYGDWFALLFLMLASYGAIYQAWTFF